MKKVSTQGRIPLRIRPKISRTRIRTRRQGGHKFNRISLTTLRTEDFFCSENLETTYDRKTLCPAAWVAVSWLIAIRVIGKQFTPEILRCSFLCAAPVIHIGLLPERPAIGNFYILLHDSFSCNLAIVWRIPSNTSFASLAGSAAPYPGNLIPSKKFITERILISASLKCPSAFIILPTGRRPSLTGRGFPNSRHR